MAKRVGWTLAAVLVGCAWMTSLQAQSDSPLAGRRDALNKLLAEEWESELKESPEMATMIGDYRYNDKLSDASIQHIRENAEKSRQWLARFEAIDTAGFPEQERLNQALMVRNLREGLEGYQLKTWEMPVSQMSGVHLDIAQFVPLIPFTTTKQYEDYLARLKQVPRLFEQTMAICEQGRKDGLMPPKFLLEKVPTQARAVGMPAGEANVFASPLKKFPADVSAPDQKRLHDEILAVIDTQVRPAYVKFAEYVEKTYAPAGRTSEGIWSLPNGDALYRYAIKSNTTTTMDPQVIHDLGMSEVARIEAEQLVICEEARVE